MKQALTRYFVGIRAGLRRLTSDPDEARRQLDAAGWVEGEDGVRVRDGQRLSMSLPYNADDPAAATFVGAINATVAQLGRVGIELVPEPLDRETFNLRLFSGQFATAFLLHLANPDPSNAVLRLASDRCPSSVPGCTAELGGNVGAYDNPEVTELLHATDAMLDPAARAAAFQEIDSILATDLPAVPLYQLPAFVAHDERLGGITFGPQRGGPLNSMVGWGYLP